MEQSELNINPSIHIGNIGIHVDDTVESAREMARALWLENGKQPALKHVEQAATEISRRHLHVCLEANYADLSISNILDGINELAYAVHQDFPDIPHAAYQLVMPSVTASAIDHWAKSVAKFHASFIDPKQNSAIYSGTRLVERDDDKLRESAALLNEADPALLPMAKAIGQHISESVRNLTKQRALSSMVLEEFESWAVQDVEGMRSALPEVDDSTWDMVRHHTLNVMRDMWRDASMPTRMN